MIKRIQNLPIGRLLLVSLIVVAVLPIIFMILQQYFSAWQHTQSEIREKHLLLAENLAAPISIYVNNHRNMLQMLAGNIAVLKAQQVTLGMIQSQISESMLHLKGFKSLYYISPQGKTLASASVHGRVLDDLWMFQRESIFMDVWRFAKSKISPIVVSPLDGKPTILMGQPIVASNAAGGELLGVVIGELDTSFIEKLRSNIRFGKKGHAAIVDNMGVVIAHPNPQWIAARKDLSSWKIVKLMMQGKMGITEFYSPFVGESMVAGYAAVPDLGWGVMVPQPKSEAEQQVFTQMKTQLIWSSIGLLLALLLAYFLSRWIINPILRLNETGRLLLDSDLDGASLETNSRAPKELKELAAVLKTLIGHAKHSRREIKDLNTSLQHRVDVATEKLKLANERLEHIAGRDHLTGLANRRCFEQSLSAKLARRANDVDTLCIMLIDVDNFKVINDNYGHAAGDAALTRIARLLDNSMRGGDLVARYGGDEFVAHLRCPQDIAHQRGLDLRKSVEEMLIPWQEGNISMTISIGIYCHHDVGIRISSEQLLHEADIAMYQAKKKGRNTVIILCEENKQLETLC